MEDEREGDKRGERDREGMRRWEVGERERVWDNVSVRVDLLEGVSDEEKRGGGTYDGLEKIRVGTF